MEVIYFIKKYILILLFATGLLISTGCSGNVITDETLSDYDASSEDLIFGNEDKEGSEETVDELMDVIDSGLLEFLIEDNATDNSDDEDTIERPSIGDLLIDFDIGNSFSYCSNVECLIGENSDTIKLSFDFSGGIPDGDDEFIYLFEFSTYEKEVLDENKMPLTSVYKDSEVLVEIPYETRYLFSRFAPAILYEGEYVLLSDGKYVSNPEILAKNTSEYPQISSKKGILFDANTIDKDEFYDLNVKRIVYNIPLSYIIGESDNLDAPTIDYEYNGEIYHFNGYLCAGFDSLFSYMQEQGIHCTAIILNDWNKSNPEIIHPKSRTRTGNSMYYAFNTAEEEGVRLMEATAMFLSERYSSGEYGLVHDWIIANEINQQKIWNYMATDNINYYTEEFEKSFRTFYNAIKSNYSNARVYFSVDHDWNDNYGNNSSFFNGRDIVYTFDECAKKGGNYDWNLAIHPYPNPLTRVKFWNQIYAKDEEAKIVTPMNLSAVTSMMTKEEFLNTKGNVRDISVPELGFSSKASEKLQATAFAYCYYIIENNEYISSFVLNRETDDRGSLKSGLALGIYNNDYSPKEIKNVFANIDSDDGQEYIQDMLSVIGAGSLEEALDWAE